jgi:hypothetical protein
MDEFLTGLERLEILKQEASDTEVSQAEALFHLLDVDESHVVTLANIERTKVRPAGLLDAAMADLLRHLDLRYGSVQRAFEIFDPKGSGEMSVAEFIRMCQEAKFTSEKRRLIMHMDPHKTGTIDLALIDSETMEAAKDAVLTEIEIKERNLEINKTKRAHFFRPEPVVGVSCGVEYRDKVRETRDGLKLLKEFKQACTRKFGSLQSAWQKLLSPEGEETIDVSVFGDAWKALNLEGEENAPDLAWMALGLKNPGACSLRELDPSIEDDLVEFKRRMVERYGSVDHAIDATDSDGSYEVDYNKFIELCFECQYRRNERRLFEYYGGDYAEKGSKVELGKIDSKALERVQTKRAEDEERRTTFAESCNGRLEASRRRMLGLPEELTEEEEALAEQKRTKEERQKQKEEQRGRRGSDGSASYLSGSEGFDRSATSMGSPTRQRAGDDPAKLFREMVVRKFGTVTRAWRVLDCQKQAALNKAEFSSSLRITGYGGSANVLWDALGIKKLISLKDIDQEAWQFLAKFRNQCQKRLKGLATVFNGEGKCNSRLEFGAFTELCKKVKLNGPYDILFDLLDVKCVGSVSWEEVKFLEEDYKWMKGNAMVVRKDATALGGTRNAFRPDRTDGIGHLGTELKPRKVFLPKTNSLPDINPKLRPNWNERHTMFDTRDNATDQMIHLMKYVKVEDEIRIARRVRQKLIDHPTEQWLSENMTSYMDDGVDYDDEEDDGWATQH